ncbi:hypothetical protein CDL12_07537 [Handroanthus impetiginosus]|uniref:Uncharacterized protein n=1 Tax=Handroanthus impetiginosus TaxID=429701 RepID=A0A2G9HQH9_9LAMI|nr:hypothetical protein CDL12_07537 [Handroanthus impetiginosus]
MLQKMHTEKTLRACKMKNVYPRGGQKICTRRKIFNWQLNFVSALGHKDMHGCILLGQKRKLNLEFSALWHVLHELWRKFV